MAKKTFKATVLFLVATLSIGAAAKAQSLQPKWITSGLNDLKYSYVEVVSGDASNIDEARDKAAQTIVARRNLAVGAAMDVHVVNGAITTSGDSKIIIAARILDEYIEQLSYGSYRVHLLVQTLKHPQYDFENVSVTDQYPFSARAFVPGMEQLHKGRTRRGIAFIAGEVVCVGALIASESMRSNYENMIPTTHNAQQRTSYIDKANNWTNIRNGFIAATAAVYIWNIIDAATCKGARYFKVEGASYALIPYTTPQLTGLALNINF